MCSSAELQQQLDLIFHLLDRDDDGIVVARDVQSLLRCATLCVSDRARVCVSVCVCVSA
jgi:hypothetical protein